MKINEVDEIVDVGKKAIRFYEQEGLLTPHRNPQNGYRDYNEEDIQQLLEEGGTTFMDRQIKDQKKSLFYPKLIASLVTLFMVALIAFFLWAFHTDPTDAPPVFLIITLFISMPIITIIGIITVTRQRLKEIKKGELDEASKY